MESCVPDNVEHSLKSRQGPEKGVCLKRETKAKQTRIDSWQQEAYLKIRPCEGNAVENST